VAAAARPARRLTMTAPPGQPQDPFSALMGAHRGDPAVAERLRAARRASRRLEAARRANRELIERARERSPTGSASCAASANANSRRSGCAVSLTGRGAWTTRARHGAACGAVQRFGLARGPQPHGDRRRVAHHSPDATSRASLRALAHKTGRRHRRARPGPLRGCRRAWPLTRCRLNSAAITGGGAVAAPRAPIVRAWT